MYERDLPLKDNGQKENVIAAKMHYELGGTDWLSGKPKPRGYYLTLVPMAVSDEGGFVRRSFSVMNGGGYTLLLEVPRRSKSRDREALLECQRRIPELVRTVLRNTGFELEDNVALSIV